MTHENALRAIVGDKGIVTDPVARRSYEVGARYDEGIAAPVVRPATTTEVSQVVSYCVSHGIAFVPQSGNTGLVGGSTPDSTGTQIVLSLDRLAQPLAIDPANRLVEVGAGVRLSTLNDRLAEHGLTMPIDLGADPMIGGMVASNTGGARFVRYGSMRRQVVGLEIVLPDRVGTVLDLTGGLRKDNSHADLKQLFIGTGGVFGIVTRAVLEAQRLPRQTATALLVPDDDEAVTTLMLALEGQCGEYLSAFEGMSRNALERAFAHVGHLKNPFARGEIPPYAILVELARSWASREGEQPLDEVLETVLGGLFEGDAPPLADALVGRPEELWAIRHSLSEGLKASGYVIAFDISLRRSDLARFRAEIVGVLGTEFPEIAICDFGHICDGGVHFNLVHPGKPDPAYLERIRTMVLDFVVGRYQGSFTGEHGLGRSNQAFYDRYAHDEVKRLSGALQSAIADVQVGNIRLGPFISRGEKD